LRSGVSRREPEAIHTPTETERTWGIGSVMTRTPLASTVVSMSRRGLWAELMFLEEMNVGLPALFVTLFAAGWAKFRRGVCRIGAGMLRE
jgi:hypothetical protein